MSRLLHPGLGDYLDRLSILELKIADGRQRGRAVAHFETEAAAIRQILDTTRLLDPTETAAYTRLAYLNRVIWDRTDQLQRLAAWWEHATETQVYTLAECGVTIFRSNEARAQLVQDLNDDDAPEKLR